MLEIRDGYNPPWVLAGRPHLGINFTVRRLLLCFCPFCLDVVELDGLDLLPSYSFCSLQLTTIDADDTFLSYFHHSLCSVSTCTFKLTRLVAVIA